MLSALAMFQGNLALDWAVHTFLVTLVALCIFGLCYFIVTKLPIPEPFKSWVFIALYILAALVAIFWLLSLVGVGGYSSPHRY